MTAPSWPADIGHWVIARPWLGIAGVAACKALSTNFNVHNNQRGAEELWLRSGFQWDIARNKSLRRQVYGYDAHRHGFTNEFSS